MKHQQPIVTNINRAGVRFNPEAYTVRREDNPELYKFLQEVKPNEKRCTV